MLIFPPAHEDPLDAAALPLVDNTELNYRTRPLPPENELRMVLLVLFGPLPVLRSPLSRAGTIGPFLTLAVLVTLDDMAGPTLL